MFSFKTLTICLLLTFHYSLAIGKGSNKSTKPNSNEQMLKKLEKELANKTKGNWVGRLACTTGINESAEEFILIYFPKETRGTCAGETLDRSAAVYLESNEYRCYGMDDGFCEEESKAEPTLQTFYKDRFAKKRVDRPYIYFIDPRKRIQIMQFSPDYIQRIGMKKAIQYCKEKAKLLSKTQKVKAECITPKA